MIIDNFKDLRKFKKILLLYSGGVDSTYALLWAKEHKIEVVAMRVVLDDDFVGSDMRNFFKSQEMTLIEKDLREEFVNQYLTLGILANGFFQNRFPVSSSYSRPLMAKYAVAIATRHDCDCIVHTSNHNQNSAARFNNAILHHNKDMVIGMPFTRDHISREKKLDTLKANKYPIKGSIYSIDKNLWARVIENNDLDDMCNPVENFHFDWPSNLAQKNEVRIVLGFKGGMPNSIDGIKMALAKIISKLNTVGGSYKIGRFNGVEDTFSGLKNHEVRQAPAATIIQSAKQFLESLVLNADELRLKNRLDYRWTELIVLGKWHSLEKSAIEASIKELNTAVNGSVELLLSKHAVFPIASKAEKALDFESNRTTYVETMTNFSYAGYDSMQNMVNLIRLTN